jgi:hypothetical protein
MMRSARSTGRNASSAIYTRTSSEEHSPRRRTELADGINAPGSRSKASRRAGRDFETLSVTETNESSPMI